MLIAYPPLPMASHNPNL